MQLNQDLDTATQVFETGKKEVKKNKNKKKYKNPIKNYKNDFHFN